ncbi:hypothetical protein COCNU_11G005360 [Cocos nucifera]|uniref:TFIID subunit TAF5 NTD2 domain-containing protein n=1 Tax=Cocos nucifera TaxID=13894 RepID=A0A8K0N977_COCNU|nr:hypothetical protein COCNU_11G005360 [Cocos nucifera]
MEEEELQKAVYAYLRKKGFRQTELVLQEEQNRLSSSAQSDLAVSRLDNDPARYHDGYSKLRSWAYSSLDLYKMVQDLDQILNLAPRGGHLLLQFVNMAMAQDYYLHELLRVLYPVFIHCFMDLVAEEHMQEELQRKLGSILLSKLLPLQEVDYVSYTSLFGSWNYLVLCLCQYEIGTDTVGGSQYGTGLTHGIAACSPPAAVPCVGTRTPKPIHAGKKKKEERKKERKDEEKKKVKGKKKKKNEKKGREKKKKGGKEERKEKEEKKGEKRKKGIKKIKTKERKERKYSYDLLLQYLQKTQSVTMLGIINERINFEVYAGQPSSISDDLDVVALVGSSQDIAKHINQKEVRWGLLEDSVEERLERALSDSEKPEGENKEQKRSVEGGKQGVSVKKLKKDKLVGATGKNIRSETSTVSIATRVKPELTLPVMTTEAEQSILEDLRNRVQLSSLALPSISFYSFLNTHNSLNCSSISHDGSLVAGGFSDSSLKVIFLVESGDVLFSFHFPPVWDMSKIGQPTKSFRLWSTKLNSNLVCYKGHNYPVWDVQVIFRRAGTCPNLVGWLLGQSNLDDQNQKFLPNIVTSSYSRIDLFRLWERSLANASGSWKRNQRRGNEILGSGMEVEYGRRESCEGTLLASGSADCTVKLWDVTASMKVPRMEENKASSTNRLRLLKALPTKSTPVYTLRFSRRNLLFAAGALSKQV